MQAQGLGFEVLHEALGLSFSAAVFCKDLDSIGIAKAAIGGMYISICIPRLSRKMQKD